MPGNTYLDVVNAVSTQFRANQTSAGAADAGKLVALDAAGRLDQSMMPSGVGADTAVITASEALAAGDLVSTWNSGGAWRVRKADASSGGKFAEGFVIAAVANGASATVYFDGPNTAVAGLSPGRQYLSTTPGGITATPPTGTGNVQQPVGVSTSAGVLNFQAGEPFQLI